MHFRSLPRHASARFRGSLLSRDDVYATSHSRHNLGAYRVRQERHTEFVSQTFVTPMNCEAAGEPAAATASLLQAWLEGLPGQRFVALNLWAVAATTQEDEAPNQRIKQLLCDETPIRSTMSDGRCGAYTEFAIHPEGYSRTLLFVGNATPRGLGRLIQRLLEIETYRMAALKSSGELAPAECELAERATSSPTIRREE